MSRPPITPAARYATVVAALLRHPDVTRSSDAAQSRKRFGSSALRIDNKIFAMLVEGRLVVKLPQQRVDALSASGEGERFEPGHGRRMKQWLTVAATSEARWLPLAAEAMEFVAAGR